MTWPIPALPRLLFHWWRLHPGAIFPPQSIIVTSFGCTLAPQCTSKRLKKLGQIGNWMSHNPRSDGLTTRNHRKSMKINEKWTSMKIHNHHAYRFPTKWLNESKWFKHINSNCVYFLTQTHFCFTTWKDTEKYHLGFLVDMLWLSWLGIAKISNSDRVLSIQHCVKITFPPFSHQKLQPKIDAKKI